MALEQGEVLGIVNAISEQMNPVVGELDSRLTAVELRIANIEPRIAGQVGAQMEPEAADHDEVGMVERVSALEAAVGEMFGAYGELRDAYNQMAAVVQSQSMALLRVLAGEGDEGVWREFVLREAIGAGINVAEYATAARAAKAATVEADG